MKAAQWLKKAKTCTANGSDVITRKLIALDFHDQCFENSLIYQSELACIRVGDYSMALLTVLVVYSGAVGGKDRQDLSFTLI